MKTDEGGRALDLHTLPADVARALPHPQGAPPEVIEREEEDPDGDDHGDTDTDIHAQLDGTDQLLEPTRDDVELGVDELRGGIGQADAEGCVRLLVDAEDAVEEESRL